MRDMIGRFIPQGISVGIDAEMPNTIKGLKGNINGLYNELRGTVDIETAKTTASVAANNIVNNYTTNNNTNDSNNNRVTGTCKAIFNIDGKEVATAIAPVMDATMDNWRSGR